MLKELILKNRSYRRFFQNEEISEKILREIINLGRLSASGGNIQSLKYIVSNSESKNALIFQSLVWAGYLRKWDGPEEGERPSAYIIILLDKQLSKSPGVDHGIAAQSILLGATERGYGGCIIGSIKKEQLKEDLNISEDYETLLVLALGKPKEKVVIEDVKDENNIKYWRDENNIHHVPKRLLNNLIIDF